MPELDLTTNPEIQERLKSNPKLLASFHLGQLESPKRLGRNSIELVQQNEKREQAWLEYSYGVELKDLFYIPEKGQNWIEEWVNFSVPEETANQFAFYLGAGYITIEEYDLLNSAMEVTRLVHGNELRRDGLRRSLNGHILPGMRLIFEMREEVINDYMFNEPGNGINFFNTLFTFLGHDWLEDSQDGFIHGMIRQFPQELQKKIENLTHLKKDGESKDDYAIKVENSGREEKFVKMLDRMVNVLDDLGKAPKLNKRKETDSTRTEDYINETRQNFQTIFAEARLPYFEKFVEVLNHVEQDSKNSRDFLNFLDSEVREWYQKDYDRKIRSGVNVNRERTPDQKMGHIIRMISDLEENSAKYGILYSTGIVGAIYLHDIVNKKSFIDRMRDLLREMDKGSSEQQQKAKLMRYSLGVAYSSRIVEGKSDIDLDYIDVAYSSQSDDTRATLKDLFRTPPKQITINSPSSRRDATDEFLSKKATFYKIRPEPNKIKLGSMKKSLEYDIEGALVRALEVIDNINHPAPFDETYAWRNSQESMYFLIPYLESLGLKNTARAVTNEVEVHIHGELYGEEVVNNVLELMKKGDESVQINNLERVINRRVGHLAVIEFDRKGVGSTIKKYVEENRTVVTDLRRCRINLPSRLYDIDLLVDGLSIIKGVIEDYKKGRESIEGSKEECGIKIERPLEQVAGRKVKLPLRISLDPDDLSEYFVEETLESIKETLNQEEDIQYEFVNRPTGYKDIKVVLKLDNPEGEPSYYEIIITDAIRHYDNTYGPAARIFKSMVHDEEIAGLGKISVLREIEKPLSPNDIQKILDALYMRSSTYIIRSNHGLNLSSKAIDWLGKRGLWGPGLGNEIIDKFDGILTENSNYLLP